MLTLAIGCASRKNVLHHNIPHSADLICSQQAMEKLPARAVGCFRLSIGCAMSLTPNVPGELRIALGRVWATLGHALDNESVRAGDHFLNAGEVMHLERGHHLVMEAYDKNTGQPVYFSWEPDAALSRVKSPRRPQHARVDVQLALRDVGSALHQAGWSLGRLMQVVAGNLACAMMRHHAAKK